MEGCNLAVLEQDVRGAGNQDSGWGSQRITSLSSRSTVNGCEAPAVRGRYGGGARIGCLIAARSTASGNISRCHGLPSVVSSTIPARPTTQHTVRVGKRQLSDPFPLRWAVASHAAPAFVAGLHRRRRVQCANGSRCREKRFHPAGPEVTLPSLDQRAGPE